MVLSKSRLKEEIKVLKDLMKTTEDGRKKLIENNEVNQLVLESLEFELNAEKFTTG